MMVGHNENMHMLYWFYSWLIFAEVMALYDENGVYILCMQLVIYHLVEYLVCWLSLIWACVYYKDFMVVWFLPIYWHLSWYLVYTTSHLSLMVDCVQIWYHGLAWYAHVHTLLILWLVDCLSKLWPFIMKIDIH